MIMVQLNTVLEANTQTITDQRRHYK